MPYQIKFMLNKVGYKVNKGFRYLYKMDKKQKLKKKSSFTA